MAHTQAVRAWPLRQRWVKGGLGRWACQVLHQPQGQQALRVRQFVRLRPAMTNAKSSANTSAGRALWFHRHRYLSKFVWVALASKRNIAALAPRVFSSFVFEHDQSVVNAMEDFCIS